MRKNKGGTYFYNHCKYPHIPFQACSSCVPFISLSIQILKKKFIRLRVFCKEYENLRAREIVQWTQYLPFMQLLLVQSLGSARSAPSLPQTDIFTEMSFQHDGVLMQLVFVECTKCGLN